MARSPRRPLAAPVAAVMAATALVAGCSNDRSATPAPLKVDLVAALTPFDACDDFLSHVKELARDRVTAYGLDGGVMYATDDMAKSAESTVGGSASSAGAPAPDAAPAAPATTVASPVPAERSSDAEGGTETDSAADSSAGDTGTNNQETGVDEADIVKVDGNRIVTVRGSELVVVTLTDGAPRVSARVDLGDTFSGDRLFLVGDRAYVLGYDSGTAEGDTPMAKRIAVAGSAGVVEVALGGDTPKATHRATIAGNLLDGRLSDGTLRLVVTSPGGTGLGFVTPNGSGAEDRALAVNRSVIDDSTVDDWLPQVSVDGDARRLVACDAAFRPADPSGLSMLSVVTIADGLGSMTATGVLADGQTTYASTDHLYVATNQWADPTIDSADDSVERSASRPAEHTDIHRFAIDGDQPARYEASGRVEGHVLNQYSMSESASGDDLRIATTSSPGLSGEPVPMPLPVPECPPNASCAVPESAPATSTTTTSAEAAGQSRIVVLRRDGGSLTQIGRVDGLGPSEQIRSVRYVGDVAYVVTFRQTDPFYVVSLSDPTSPKVLGELKVPGFSSYLHPVGDHLVLGVGSAATDSGRITGAKLSLYDTTDPTAPREVTSWTDTNLAFLTDSDPHAFDWDGERSLAVLPYIGTGCSGPLGDCPSAPVNGALVVRIADGGITEVGRLTHLDRTPPPDAPAPTTTTAPPATTVPETTVPETTVPETTVPETTVPETTVPETTVPEATPPIVCDPAACDPAPWPYDPGPVVPTISRALIVGDHIVTLSDVGVASHTVDGLRFLGFAAF